MTVLVAPLADYQECYEECGPYSIIKSVVEVQSRVRIWYTTELTAYPYFNGSPNYSGYFNSTISGGSIEFNIPHDFGTVPISYCIYITTVIKFDDGSCCVYINYVCADLG